MKFVNLRLQSIKLHTSIFIHYVVRAEISPSNLNGTFALKSPWNDLIDKWNSFESSESICMDTRNSFFLRVFVTVASHRMGNSSKYSCRFHSFRYSNTFRKENRHYIISRVEHIYSAARKFLKSTPFFFSRRES